MSAVSSALAKPASINLEPIASINDDLNSEIECTICTDPFTAEGANTPFVLSNCGHTFHENCIPKQENQYKCPLCRVISPKINKNFTVAKLIGIAQKLISNNASAKNLASNPPAPKPANEEREKEVSKLKSLSEPAADPSRPSASIRPSISNSVNNLAAQKLAKEDHGKEANKLKILDKPCMELAGHHIHQALGVSVGQLIDPPIITKENIGRIRFFPTVQLDNEGFHIQFPQKYGSYARQLAVSLKEAGFNSVQFHEGVLKPSFNSSLTGGYISISSPSEYLELIAKHCKINNGAQLKSYLEDSIKDRNIGEITKQKIESAFASLVNSGIITA